MSEWKNISLADAVSKLGDGLHGTPKYDDNGEYYFINHGFLERPSIGYLH
jgi:type I restriction enzyme S subunit